MQSKLVKAWGPYAVGTVVVDNKAEAAATPGAVRVSPARFAKLQEDGHFAPAEPTRPIPAEVRTSPFGPPPVRAPVLVDSKIDPDRAPFRQLGREGQKSPDEES